MTPRHARLAEALSSSDERGACSRASEEMCGRKWRGVAVSRGDGIARSTIVDAWLTCVRGAVMSARGFAVKGVAASQRPETAAGLWKLNDLGQSAIRGDPKLPWCG